MLEGVYKDNFKELSRRMQDMGWERNNNQCRQQIEILKRRFDDMQDASKKSGSVLYFEPLRVELNDCFGALKDVRPDAVFSSRSGLKITKPDEADEEGTEGDTEANGDGQARANTSKDGNVETPKKKVAKCN